MPPSLFSEVIRDFEMPGMIWQVGAVVLCAALGWGLSHLFRRTLDVPAIQPGVVRLGVESFARVLPPVLTLMLLIIAKFLLAEFVLADYQRANLLRVVIPLVASLALIRFVFYVLQRTFDRDGTPGKFLLAFEKFFAVLVWAGVALYITGLWPAILQELEHTVLPIGRSEISMLAILQALASVVVTLVLAFWAGAALEDRLMQLNTMHSSLRTVMARMARAMLVLVAILISLSLVGIDLTVLSVFGGALGVALGLGLQKIASNYVSGFVILLERGLAIGDMVTVDKYYGKVTEINTRYTVLRGLDGVESAVPNEMFVSTPVQNHSLSDHAIRLSTQLVVEYCHDVESLLSLLQQTVASIERVAKITPPSALLIKFGPDGLELEVGFWIVDPENGRLNVLSDVNRAIWRILKEHKIRIAYPKRELTVRRRHAMEPAPSLEMPMSDPT
jgi:small-conductance mechanosensitive channel